MAWLLFRSPSPAVLSSDDFDVDKSCSREGEGGLRGTPVVVEAVRAQAGVAVLLVAQPREAGGSVLTLVVHTAVEFDVAAVSSPREFTGGLNVGTVADVGGHAVYTPAAIKARLALTLVDVDLTDVTWEDGIIVMVVAVVDAY